MGCHRRRHREYESVAETTPPQVQTKTEISQYSRPFPKPKLLQAQANEQAQDLHSSRFNAFTALANNPAAWEPPQPAVPIMPKLTVGAVGDKYEQEADNVAVQVVQQLNNPSPVQQPKIRDENADNPLQRQSLIPLKAGDAKEQDMFIRQGLYAPQTENSMQMQPLFLKPDSKGQGTSSPDIEQSIQQERGKGQSLAESVRKPMEGAFGTNFEQVRIHTDNVADQLNQSIQAKAFTTGQDVFFRQGAYAPQSKGGQELLAHELTHVVQKNVGTVQCKSMPTIQCDVDAEDSVEPGRVKSLIEKFEKLAQDNAEAPAKNIAEIDEDSVEENKDVVKYFVLQEMYDPYEGEETDSSKFVFDKIFGTKYKSHVMLMPKNQRSQILKKKGWNDEEIEAFNDTLHSQVEYLDTEESRADYELIVSGGKLMQGDPPELYDTSEMYASGIGHGHAIFVMSPNGKIYANAHKIGRFHHSSFLAGLPTAAAGTIQVDDGRLETITCKTGHYSNQDREQRQAFLYQFLLELESRGVDLDLTDIYDYDLTSIGRLFAKDFLSDMEDKGGSEFLKVEQEKTEVRHEQKAATAEERRRKKAEEAEKIRNKKVTAEEDFRDDLIDYTRGRIIDYTHGKDPLLILRREGLVEINEDGSLEFAVLDEDGDLQILSIEQIIKIIKGEIDVNELRNSFGGNENNVLDGEENYDREESNYNSERDDYDGEKDNYDREKDNYDGKKYH